MTDLQDQLSLLTVEGEAGLWVCRVCHGDREVPGRDTGETIACPCCLGAGSVPFDPYDLSTIPF